MNTKIKDIGEIVLAHEQPENVSEPLLVTVEDSCKLLSCSKTKLFGMINAGLLERRKLGKATRVTLSSIRSVAGYRLPETDKEAGVPVRQA